MWCSGWQSKIVARLIQTGYPKIYEVDLEALDRPNGVQPSQAADSQVDLRILARILLRRKWVALGTLLLCLFVGIVVTVRAPRIYRSASLLLIEQNAPEVLSGVREVYDLGTAAFWATQEYYETQYRIIRSRPVAEKVVMLHGLGSATILEELKNSPGGMEPTMGQDPLVGLSEGLRGKLQLLGFDRVRSRKEIEDGLKGFDVVSFIQRKVRVDPVKDSRLVQVSIEDTDPERAATIANAVADAYIEVNLDQKLDMTRSAIDWLSTQMRELKTKLDQSEMALYEFKKENNVVSVSIEDKQTMISQTLTELNQSLSSAQAKRIALESRWNQVRVERDKGVSVEGLEQVVSNDLIHRLKTSYSELRQEEAELETRYTEQHPKLVAVRKKIELLKRDLDSEVGKILSSLEEEFRTAQQTENRLRDAIERVKSDALELNKKEIDYTRLKRESDNNQALYDLIIKRQKEADLTQMLKVNNVRKLEAAQVPKEPILPRVRLNLALSLLLGIMLGLGLALVTDFLDSSIKGQEQVEQVLGLPFLGVVPAIKNEQGKVSDEPKDRDQYVTAHPRSTVAECYRSIRTSLMFMSPDHPARTLLVTSSGPREGKSTTSINLAIVMAQSGAKTLLIDADMRRPRLHRTFGLDNSVGFSSLIMQETTLEKAIRQSGVQGLDILTCGPIPPNPVELLHTKNFKTLLDTFTQKYDRVIFDSPPVTAVTDPLVLSSMMDGTVLVIQAGRTSWQMAKQAKRRLEDVGARIFGVVLNNVDFENRRAGDNYDYYYYYYNSDYSENEKSAPAKA